MPTGAEGAETVLPSVLEQAVSAPANPRMPAPTVAQKYRRPNCFIPHNPIPRRSTQPETPCGPHTQVLVEVGVRDPRGWPV